MLGSESVNYVLKVLNELRIFVKWLYWVLFSFPIEIIASIGDRPVQDAIS